MISLRSDLRRKLLTFFYVNRSARIYVRQLAVALAADSTNVSRELARLAREGLLRAETEGRQLYYTINRDYPYLNPVFSLLQGSIGIEPELRHALQAVPGIQQAWLFGSFAKNQADASSDIDLLLIGEPDQAQLAVQLRRAEKTLRREINSTVFTPQELKRRLRKADPFVTDIWNGNRVELIAHGDEAAENRHQAGAAVLG
jgi:predicted nucleotidyltransferase